MEKEYRYYGSDEPEVAPVADIYPGIKNQRDLYDALSHVWCAETCAPRMRQDWRADNPTHGQCSITAFLVQDIFGGKVYGVPREGGNFHCYNDVDGVVFDLTSEQFGDEILDYSHNPEQFRDVHFSKEEKRLRYEDLKVRLKDYLGRES